MGIIDDMENFIFDRFSVTKRHNVHQIIEITNNGNQQTSRSEQQTSSSEIESRSSPRGQRADQVGPRSQQGQMRTAEQVSSHREQPGSPAVTHVQNVVSRSQQNQVTSEQSVSRQDQPESPSLTHVRSSPRRDTSNSPSSQRAQRSPQIPRQLPSSPFRERVSWHERSRPPSALSDLHSPQLEHRPLPSPIRTRHRASWVELSNLSSLDNLTSAHLYNRPPSAGPTAESPTTPQKQNAMNEHVSLPSTFRSEPRLSSLDRPAFMVAGADLPQFGKCQQPTNGITVTTIVKPKLVRLRSEPSSFSPPSAASGFPPIDPQSPHSAIRCRRRRLELKRSHSLEVAPSSCQEELWTGINVPSQLVITRPQLSRSRLNRKHLSLQLEGMSEDLNSLVSDPSLTFHETHGDNIQLLNNKTRARRYESFCKGICFSNRPISVNERVYVKFVETNTTWSGVLRFGFTSVDPATIQGCDLPRYACPDLTNKPGNWAKALGELYTTSHILLRFSVSRTGDVTYAVNGEDKGLFFSGVDTTKDLWAMLDIYGNTVAVEFSHANAELELPNVQSQIDTSPVDHITQAISAIDFHRNNTRAPPSQSPTVARENARGSEIQVQYHVGVQFNSLPFHNLQGRNVRVSADHITAVRLPEEYCNAFVFTGRSLLLGETIVIQVLGVDRSYIGGLGFGLTACDPGVLHPGILPDDSDLLLDRPEYWVVNKDVCRNPEIGDELSFHVTAEGEVRYSRNKNAPVTLMHVDRTLPLWAFFDVYGNIQEIKILGSTMSQVQGHPPRPQPESVSPYPPCAEGGCIHPNSLGMEWPSRNTSPRNSAPKPAESKLSGQKQPHPSSVPATPTSADSSQEDSGECKVCCERAVNCVLYTCGHMCLCFTCATVIKEQRGDCPICRRQISDIIKVYRA